MNTYFETYFLYLLIICESLFIVDVLNLNPNYIHRVIVFISYVFFFFLLRNQKQSIFYVTTLNLTRIE